MKKIIMGIAAVAMAVSMFAADVSAKVKIDGSLFNYNAATKETSALKIFHATEPWNPDMSFAVSGENAGAEFKVYSFNWGKLQKVDVVYDKEDPKKLTDVTLGEVNANEKLTSDDSWRVGNTFNPVSAGYKIWIKPIDLLKFTFGMQDYCLNQEQIDWSDTKTKAENSGYALNLASGAFSFDAFLAPGWGNAWFGKADGEDATVAETYLKAQYGADFGTINGMLWAKDTFKDLTFGAGYANTVSDIFFFVNAHGNYYEKFLSATGEVFVKGNAGDLGWAAFIRPTYVVDADTKLFAKAKLTYSAGSLSPYLYLKCEDILADNFVMEIKPGVTGSVGACGWEIALDITAKEKITVDVPVNFSVSF